MYLRIALAVIAAFPLLAIAQVAPNTASVMVGYNSLKNSAKPDSSLRLRVDSIDRAIANAARLGQTAELRHQVAKGTALLNRRDWTPADDYRQSLVLRSDRLFADPAVPYPFRLEQLYSPGIDLTKPLSARVSIRAAGAPGSATPNAPRLLAEYQDVSRDLRDVPLRMEVDLSAVADGPEILEVEVLDSARTLGIARLRIAVVKGLESRLGRLEKLASSAPADVQPDIRYPADYVRKVNHSLVDASSFNLGRELTIAESIGTGARGKRNPFVGKTGDIERHYVLDVAHEIMPYRVYVPKAYTGKTAMPLIIALHGLGGTEDSFMDSYARRLPELAESRGYIVAAPLGYRSDGFYGFPYGRDAASRAKQEFSEKDVMEVLAHMRAQYRIDDQRIYLMGHSMGAIGTWFLGAKYPDIWAALGTFAGLGDTASEERMKRIPQFVVHGDADPTVAVSGSRRMVEAMKKFGVDYKYVEVPGGNHSSVVVPNLEGMFDFFDTKRKAR